MRLQTVPVIAGIPLLVRDPEAHENDMAGAKAVNPLWYQDEQSPEETSPWRHHLRKRRLYVSGLLKRELAARGEEKASRLLDLGCGDGNNLAWLGQFAHSLWGSDYNLIRLARAKKIMPEAETFLANILDYPAPDNTFDMIFFNHVIEHIPDDMAALKEIRRILAPGGRLVLGAPNEGCWWWQLAYQRDPESLKTTDHVHFYTLPLIRERMENAGFRILETKYMGWGPPDWRLDGKIRKYKWVDDAFEFAGKLFFPSQASSFYLLANKA